jgi:calpain-15
MQCNESCFSWLLFTDRSFPASDASLGRLESKPQGIKWVRLTELVKLRDKDAKPALFDDTIAATDVCQGALGDCWLLAAFATLCERKTFIQNCFVTRCFNPRGKYVIRLYDQATKGFYNVTVDDFIPCDANNRPLFTQFNGQEMWPLLLEKAYAKSKGTYAAIEGGRPLAAMIDLTGYLGETVVGPFDEKAFARLQRCINKGCLLAAGSRGVDNTRVEGRGAVKSTIVGGHAYSILDIKTPMLTTQKIRLLKIRNPWYVCAALCLPCCIILPAVALHLLGSLVV